MIIDDPYIFGASFGPAKADAKLVVDADAVLTRTVAFKRPQSVPGWYTQVVESARDLQLTKLAPGDLLDLLESFDPTSNGECFCIGVLERLDHSRTITHHVINVQRE